jgi:hypothetical protein
MSRIKATAIHLLLSVLLVSSSLLIVITFWYPDIYRQIPEFRHIIKLLFFVDITLGPLLTFVVFKPNKKGLKFDLTVIAIMQIGALIYGISTLFNARPVFMVFNIDRFTAVSANEIPEKSLASASEAYKMLSLTGPILVAARLPENPQEREKILFSVISDNVDLAQIPEHYLPYSEVANEVKNKIKSLALLSNKSTENQSIINKALNRLNLSIERVGYLPVVIKSQDFIALVDRENAMVLEYLAIDGWQ